MDTEGYFFDYLSCKIELKSSTVIELTLNNPSVVWKDYEGEHEHQPNEQEIYDVCIHYIPYRLHWLLVNHTRYFHKPCTFAVSYRIGHNRNITLQDLELLKEELIDLLIERHLVNVENQTS
jgi:hypothetical protein